MSDFHQRVLLVGAPEHQEMLDALDAFAKEHGIKTTLCDHDTFLKEPGRSLDFAEHVVAVTLDQDFSAYVNLAKTLNFSLGIIPVTSKSRLYGWFHLPRKREDQFALAFSLPTQAIDVLRCNDEVVMGMVMLGETPFLDQRSKTYLNRDHGILPRLAYWFMLLWVSVRNLTMIKPFPLRLTTGKGKTIHTAITGLVSIENDVRSAAAKLINTSLSVQDGKVSTVIISPKSVTEYLSFLLTALLKGDKGVKRLPSAVSYIKSQKLTIEANQPLEYYVDGARREADVIDLELYPQAVNINVTDAYHDRNKVDQPGKDTMKVENLPTNQSRLDMIQSHLPLFTRALEDDFKDLFLILRENAKAPPHYVALMVLSVVVASLGLYLSSAAVIIGAMVLAPLMSPIISLSMGMLRQENVLLKQSLQSIVIGVGLALLTAAALGMLIPIQKITPEMAGRLQPNLLDMGVAIASGIAGGYAHARESVMKSLPGVAIAVALVPPLSVAGLGIGWWQWEVFSGAMLLFVTNLVGITLAAALTFLVLGYAPLVRARKGLMLTAVLLAVVAVPLSLSFQNMYQRWVLEGDIVDAGPFALEDITVSLSQPQISFQREGVTLRADVLAPRQLALSDLQSIQHQLESRWNQPVALELTPRLSLPLSAVP